MCPRFVVVLLACLVASTAWAQFDDDLAPLAPIQKAKKKPKPPAAKPKAKPKAKSATGDGLAAPGATTGEVKIRLEGEVSWALLSIDGREMGTLPLGPQALPPGEHTLAVRRPGFSPFERTFTITAGRTVEMGAQLSAVAAILTVKGNTPGAQVFLNDTLIGTVPLFDFEAPPGEAKLRVKKAGQAEWSRTLTLVAGVDAPVEVNLAPASLTSDRPLESKLTPQDVRLEPVATLHSDSAPPITQRWYFWAGVVAVVAAAAGTAVGVYAYNSTSISLTGPMICKDKDGNPSPCTDCLNTKVCR